MLTNNELKIITHEALIYNIYKETKSNLENKYTKRRFPNISIEDEDKGLELMIFMPNESSCLLKLCNTVDWLDDQLLFQSACFMIRTMDEFWTIMYSKHNGFEARYITNMKQIIINRIKNSKDTKINERVQLSWPNLKEYNAFVNYLEKQDDTYYCLIKYNTSEMGHATELHYIMRYNNVAYSIPFIPNNYYKIKILHKYSDKKIEK